MPLKGSILKDLFPENGMREIRALEAECEEHASYFWDNRREAERAIRQICETLSGEGKA